MEMMLSGRPARPSLKFEGRRGSPRSRFKAMQEMETMYEAIIAAVEREAMFMRAVVDPRFMRERRQEVAKAKQMALMGTSYFGETWSLVVLVWDLVGGGVKGGGWFLRMQRCC